MTRADARIILNGLLPDGFNAQALSRDGRREVRAAVDRVLELVYDPVFDAGVSRELRIDELLVTQGKRARAAPAGEGDD